MLGKFIFPEQSKTKVNDFAMRVANKKRRLHSSRQLSWSLRTGWQVVSTTIFEWILNLQLKMWTNYRIVAADNLLKDLTVDSQLTKLHLRFASTKSSDASRDQKQLATEVEGQLRIKAPSVTCFGLVTCWVKVWQIKTGCPLRNLCEVMVSKAEVKVTSFEKWKLWAIY